VTILDGPLKGYMLLLCPESANVSCSEMIAGTYEAFLYEALLPSMQLHGRVVWDVGAHIGYHTLALAALVGQEGHVVSVEPNPYNRERLRKNLRKNKTLRRRVIVVPGALSDRDGEAVLSFSDQVDSGLSSGSHLCAAPTPESPSAYSAFRELTVPTMKADTVFRKLGVPPPSVVKIDVEGAEWLVLKGAEQLLNFVRPVLIIEVHHIGLMLRVHELLLRAGYSVEILERAPLSPSRCFVLASPTDCFDERDTV